VNSARHGKLSRDNDSQLKRLGLLLLVLVACATGDDDAECRHKGCSFPRHPTTTRIATERYVQSVAAVCE